MCICVCDTGKTSPLNDDEIDLNHHKLACLSLLFQPHKFLYYSFLRYKDVLRFLFELMENLLSVLLL